MATKNNQPFIYPIAFMIILAALLTFVLAFLNQSTEAIISQQESLAVQKSILYALDVPYSSDEEVQQITKEHVQLAEKSGYSYYEYRDNGQVTKYAFPIAGKALWGTVDGFGGTNAEVTQLLGLDFVKQSETPGLGGRIEEEWYKVQFRGIDISGASPYVAYKPAQGGNIDAITGATLTSNSVRDMVNDSIDLFKQTIKGVSQ